MLALEALVDFLLPRGCEVCGKELYVFEKHICTECLANMPLTYFWITKNNMAEEVFWGRIKIERVYSLFFYINNYKYLLYKIKYRGNTNLGKWLGAELAKKIRTQWKEINIDLVVPVPLHPIRKLRRGYNQAEIIAQGIANELNIKVSNKLIRRKHYTRTQTKKDKIDRWQSVANAFESKKSKVKPHHILLVDDVFTTGATLEACAIVLTKEYHCLVSIATLAYVE